MMKTNLTKKAPAAATADVKNINKKSSTNDCTTYWSSTGAYTQKQLKAIESLTCTAAYFLGKRDVWLSRYSAYLMHTTVGEIIGKNATDKHFLNLMMCRSFSDTNDVLFQRYIRWNGRYE